jgi:hypothetical protein
MKRTRMKRIVRIRWLFRLIVVAMWAFTDSAASAKNEPSDFAFVIGLGRSESQKPHLIGMFEPDVKVTVFHSGSDKPCPAETSSGGSHVGPPERGLEDNADFTAITGECADKVKIGVALVGKPVIDFRSIHIQEIKDSIRIGEIDKAVRASGVFESLRKKSQDLNPGEPRELAGIVPKVHQISQPGADIIIVTYNKEQQRNAAAYSPPASPRAIIINGTPYPLTGWCSFDTFHVFSLNNRLFIQSGSCCCGCGIVGFELFEITKGGPKVFLSDDSLSN